MTRLTLRTHDLPDFFGAVHMTIKAASDEAFRRLIGRLIALLQRERCSTRTGASRSPSGRATSLTIAMVFQGLDQQQAETIWRPFFDWLAAFAAGLQHRVSTVRSWPRRRGRSGTRHSSSRSPRRSRWPTTGRRSGRRTSSGRATWRKPGRSCTATSRPGSPPSLLQPDRQESSRRRAVRRDPALGRVAALQQGACGRARRGDRRGQRHGDESRRARRLRAGHQRGRGAARLSRHSRSRTRSRRPLANRRRRSTAP